VDFLEHLVRRERLGERREQPERGRQDPLRLHRLLLRCKFGQGAGILPEPIRLYKEWNVFYMKRVLLFKSHVGGPPCSSKARRNISTRFRNGSKPGRRRESRPSSSSSSPATEEAPTTSSSARER